MMESRTTMATDGAPQARPGSGLSKADREKWNNNIKKTSDLEKLLLML